MLWSLRLRRYEAKIRSPRAPSLSGLSLWTCGVGKISRTPFLVSSTFISLLYDSFTCVLWGTVFKIYTS